MLLQAEAYRSCRRTYLYCLSDRKSMSSLLLLEQAEADHSCRRTYLCYLSDRKSMSSLLLRELQELLQVLPAGLRRSLSEAVPEPAELHQDLLL